MNQNDNKPKKIDHKYLLPYKFQPINLNNFLFEIEGLSPGLVKSVQRPAFIKSDFGNKTEQRISVTVMDSPETESQLKKLTYSIPFGTKATLYYLDPLNQIIKTVTYHEVEVDRIDYKELDVASTELGEITVSFKFRSASVTTNSKNS